MGDQIYPSFTDWSVDRIESCKKRSTTRYNRLGEIGDWFEIGETRYYISMVKRITVKELFNKYWKIEGADSKEELRQVWIGLHPKRGIRENDKVWFHIFDDRSSFDYWERM